MFSKTNKTSKIDVEQREQYQYARKRMLQKKRLMQHFILFLAGGMVLVIINPVLGIGNDFFIKDWFVWTILIWVFIFLIHLFNVLILNKFMNKEWESRQLEKLKLKQEERIDQLEKEHLENFRETGVKKKNLSNPIPPRNK